MHRKLLILGFSIGVLLVIPPLTLSEDIEPVIIQNFTDGYIIDNLDGTKTLQSFPTIVNVQEDGKWKPIEEARSLKNYIDFIITEQDSNYEINLSEYNFTGITGCFRVDEALVGQQIPLEIYHYELVKDAETGEATNVKTTDRNLLLTFSTSEVCREIELITSIEGKYIKLGAASTEGRFNTTSTYGGGEGSLWYGDASWDTAHDALSAESGDNSAIYWGVMSQEAAEFNIERAFIPIDTAPIPDDATINSATFCAKVDGNGGGCVAQDNDGNDFLVLVESLQADVTSLDLPDYDLAGDAVDNPTEWSERLDISTGAWSTGDWVCWDLDADGLAGIDVTGATPLAMREGHDVVDNTIGNNKDNWCYFVSSKDGTADDRPHLNVTYTEAGGTCECPTGEDWVISDASECSLTTDCHILPYKLLISSGYLRIDDGGSLNAAGCYVEDGSGLYVDSAGALKCGI